MNDFGCDCSAIGTTARVSTTSLPSLVAALHALSDSIQPAQTVVGLCNDTTVSARFANLQNIADEVRFDFPVVVGEDLARAVADGTSAKIVPMGLNRFSELLPSQELFCLLPAGATGPRFERMGLALLDHNLPNVWDSFVGREDEIKTGLDLMDSWPLVTIKGCGGIGKSRLAIHLAAATRSLGVEVVRFVPLGSIKPGRGILAEFAKVCPKSAATASGFIDAYRNKRTVLVLDNCEHVLVAVRELIVRLAEDFPLLTVLATSRIPIGLAGEAVFEIEPLTVPPADELEWPALEIESVGAARLFRDRCIEHMHTQDLSVWRKDIFRICRLLDGLPLAIEHAAYRASTMTPTETLESLSGPLSTLKTDRKDVDPRHQTIEATIRWSYNLLDADERTDLVATSVFRGPFDNADFVSLFAGMAEPSRVANLFRKSMIRKHGLHKNRQAFSMLEVVADFVRALPEYDAQSRPFVDGWFRRARRLAEGFRLSSESKPSEVDISDVRFRYASIVWALDNLFDSDSHAAVQLTKDLLRLWMTDGPYFEARDFIGRSLKTISPPWEVVVADGIFRWLSGDTDGAERVFLSAAETGDLDGNPIMTASAKANLASLWQTSGKNPSLIAALQSAAGDKFLEAGEIQKAVTTLANLAQNQLESGAVADAGETLHKIESLGASNLRLSISQLAILRWDYYDVVGNIQERSRAVIDGLESCKGSPNAENLPPLLLRAAVTIVETNPLLATEVFGSAMEAYSPFPVATKSRTSLISRYRSVVDKLIKQNDRIRAESKGANIDPNYRSLFSLSALVV